MRLENEKVILRDLIASDVEDRVHWQTAETEWLSWDAPWENDPKSIFYEPFNEEQYRQACAARLARPLDEDAMRMNFQICANDGKETHIGWCNCYYIDEDYNYTRYVARHAIGIDIPAMAARHKGYATAAWTLFIRYLLAHGVKDIYTQTWSGNLRVQGLIKKLGFIEVSRKKDRHIINGEYYDALTFRLDRYAFERTARRI